MTPKQLQALIDNAGKTQVGLAKEMGIGTRTMRYYSAGDWKIPMQVAIAARCLCSHPQNAKPLNAAAQRDYSLLLSLWDDPAPRAVQIAARCLCEHQFKE